MTLDQAGIVLLLLLMLVVFALDRFRIEVVALAGLGLGVLLGLVPSGQALSGLASPAVVTVVEILLIVQALERSRLPDSISAGLPDPGSPRRVVAVICTVGAGVSTVMNNVGAFGLMLPVVFSASRRAGLAPRTVLMPLSFATLLGGLCTLVGTPANLLVSDALHDARGAGFSFLDFAPTGLAVAAAGLVAIVLWAPRALAVAGPAEAAEEGRRRIVTECLVRAAATAGDLAAGLDGTVHAAERDGRRLFPLRDVTELLPGDKVLLDADAARLRAALDGGRLASARSAGEPEVEAVVMPASVFVGSRVATIPALSAGELHLVAVTTHNPRIEGSLDELQLAIGDVLHLEGDPDALDEFLDDGGLMQVAPSARREPLRFSPAPAVVFALGIALAAFGLAPPEIAFGAVVVALAVSGHLDLRQGLADLNWPVVLLLVAMLPLGEAVATTGAAAAIAGGLRDLLPVASPLAAAALMLGLAMAITPFVNNATTAVVLAPIAVELARAAGVSPALTLMAVAIGASSDFLTPFGHHNNTLAYGLGGYRFRDFPRTGWPVSLAAFAAGTLACVLVWS